MKDNEIMEEMNKYAEILKREKEEAFGMIPEDDDEPLPIDIAKENVHKAAIECLDKILSPELKVFIKNLCFNKLGYPDEPIFYKIFGEYPKVGDKVSEDDLIKRGIDEKMIYEYEDIWGLEGTSIGKEVIDGKTYFVIDQLWEVEDADSEEVREWLRNSSELKKFISKESKLDAATKKKMFDTLDKVVPMLGKLKL